MIDTAYHYNIQWQFLGIGTKFINHTQRIQLLSKTLSKLPNNTIVLCMDGADTLFNNDMSCLLNTFLKQKTKILISAEKLFNHQYEEYRNIYNDQYSYTPYRYVNAGTFMGYCKYLKIMIKDLIYIKKHKYAHANDQGLLGIWVSKHFNSHRLVKLDTSCEVFWVTSSDIDNLTNQNSYKIKNNLTNTYPSVIHCAGINWSNDIHHYTLTHSRIMNYPTNISLNNKLIILFILIILYFTLYS